MIVALFYIFVYSCYFLIVSFARDDLWSHPERRANLERRRRNDKECKSLMNGKRSRSEENQNQKQKQSKRSRRSRKEGKRNRREGEEKERVERSTGEEAAEKKQVERVRR